MVPEEYSLHPRLVELGEDRSSLVLLLQDITDIRFRRLRQGLRDFLKAIAEEFGHNAFTKARAAELAETKVKAKADTLRIWCDELLREGFLVEAGLATAKGRPSSAYRLDPHAVQAVPDLKDRAG